MARARGPLKAAFSAQRSAFSFRPIFDLLPGHRDERQVLGHKDCGHADAHEIGDVYMVQCSKSRAENRRI